MGMDPITIAAAAAAASSIGGAISSDRTNARNTRAYQTQQGLINSRAQGMMQSGTDPFAQQLMDMLKGGPNGFQAPTNITTPVIGTGMVTGNQGFNTGQDALSQMIRSGGQPFDTSKMFAALAPLDQRNIASQVAGLHGASTSLGQRFGSATLGAEGRMRGNFAQDIAARNAGIQQSAYEAAQGRTMSAAGQLQQGGLQQAGLLAQIAQANAGNSMQGQQFNSTQQQAYNQFLSAIIGQAGGFQNAQSSRNAQLLSIMAGINPAQQQPSGIPGAGSDISSMLMFLPFLRQMMPQSPINIPGYIPAPNIPSNFPTFPGYTPTPYP